MNNYRKLLFTIRLDKRLKQIGFTASPIPVNDIHVLKCVGDEFINISQLKSLRIFRSKEEFIARLANPVGAPEFGEIRNFHIKGDDKFLVFPIFVFNDRFIVSMSIRDRI